MSNLSQLMRRPIEEHSRFVLGVLAVAVILAVLAGLLAVGRLGAGETKYEAEFLQAAGIRAGDAVTVAGVQVGSVDGSRLAGDHVVVAFSVDDGVPMGEATRASIKLTTLLGSRYVELRPAGPGGLPGGRIPIDNTSVPYDLQQVLADATTTFEDVDAAKIGDAMTTLSSQLAGTPELVPQVLANIETLSTILADRRDQIGSLLRNSAELTTAVREQQGRLGEMIRDGNALVQQVMLRQQTLERLLSSTTVLVDQLDRTVNRNRPEIDALVASLRGLLQSLSANDALLRNTLQILPVPLRSFSNASGTANEVDFTAPSGPLVDSWMCAISGQANLRNLAPYLKDCQ